MRLFQVFFFLKGRVSRLLGWFQSCFVAQGDLELLIDRSLPSECWDYRQALPRPVLCGAGTEPRASCMFPHRATVCQLLISNLGWDLLLSTALALLIVSKTAGIDRCIG